MSIRYQLPKLAPIASKPYVSIAGKWLFLGGISKHEYALLLTATRLIVKISEDYQRAKHALDRLYSTHDSLHITSIIECSNYLESVISDLYRLTDVISALIKDYPKHFPSDIPDFADKLAKANSQTKMLRHASEHITNLVIGDVKKGDSKMGFINIGIDDTYIHIGKQKVKIYEVVDWIQMLSSYIDRTARTF